MQIAEIIESIVKEAQLKEREEIAVVWRFGWRGETKNLNERIAMFKADEKITVKVDRDWVRKQEANGLRKMRSAMMRLKVNVAEFREACKEEPYKSLCDVLIGFGE